MESGSGEVYEKTHYHSRLALRTSYGLTAKMNEQAVNSTTVFKHVMVNRTLLKDRENALRILHLEIAI